MASSWPAAVEPSASAAPVSLAGWFDTDQKNHTRWHPAMEQLAPGPEPDGAKLLSEMQAKMVESGAMAVENPLATLLAVHWGAKHAPPSLLYLLCIDTTESILIILYCTQTYILMQTSCPLDAICNM
jgi:hypothetical protein